MADIEVEAVETIDPPVGVDAPAVVLYGGKGGVGKTTMAAATALASARDGTPTLVVSTDPAHSLSDTFERPIPHTPSQILDDDPLYAAEIDPDEAMESGFGGFTGIGDSHPLSDLFGDAVMPGADEAMALQTLMKYLTDDRFERIVIDTAPTGHTLRLLSLPEILDTMVGRMVTLKERFSGMMDGLNGLFGESDESDDMPGLDELRAKIETVRTVLRDPNQTDFRLVVVPETMSIDESQRLVDALAAQQITVGTIVVNRIMEDPAAITETLAPDLLASPNIDSCAFCQQRWNVQRSALEQAQSLFQGRSIKRVPLLAKEVRGTTMLDIVGACLD